MRNWSQRRLGPPSKRLRCLRSRRTSRSAPRPACTSGLPPSCASARLPATPQLHPARILSRQSPVTDFAVTPALPSALSLLQEPSADDPLPSASDQQPRFRSVAGAHDDAGSGRGGAPDGDADASAAASQSADQSGTEERLTRIVSERDELSRKLQEARFAEMRPRQSSFSRWRREPNLLKTRASRVSPVCLTD